MRLGLRCTCLGRRYRRLGLRCTCLGRRHGRLGPRCTCLGRGHNRHGLRQKIGRIDTTAEGGMKRGMVNHVGRLEAG